MAHCDRGDEYLVATGAHLQGFKVAGCWAASSPSPSNTPKARCRRSWRRQAPGGPFYALENNLSRYVPRRARRAWRLHLDGARVRGKPLTALPFGIHLPAWAPVDVVLVGSKDRPASLAQGADGGLRQSGRTGRCPPSALEHHVARQTIAKIRALAEGSAVAQLLARIRTCCSWSFEPARCESLTSAPRRCAPCNGGSTRSVTHLPADDVQRVVQVARHLARNGGAAAPRAAVGVAPRPCRSALTPAPRAQAMFWNTPPRPASQRRRCDSVNASA